MNPVIFCRPPKSSISRSADLMKAAERELAAFFNAVTQLAGREQAELAADDWLRELMKIDGLPCSTRAWRSITVKASAGLATRLNASSLSAEFTNA